MRIQLSPSPDADGQQGAVAIIVAILLTVLLVMSAFAVDFGQSYANKRQLQTSADAAVLAAAATYVDDAGSCGTLAGNAALTNTARTAAQEIMEDNHLDATRVGDIDVGCDPAGSGRLQVTWTNENATDAGLSGVIGVDEINATRRATAEVGVPASGVGLRPFAICSAAIPDNLPSALINIDYDGFVSTGQCPEAHTNGNWWALDCPYAAPEPPAGGNALLTWRIANGCASPLEVVAGQEPYYSNPSALSAHLLGVPTPCNGSPDVDCLGPDTGEIRSRGVRSEWEFLLGKTMTFPVICGSYSAGTRSTCTRAAVHDAGGNNTQYPIHAFTGAIVCGFQFGNNGTRRSIDTGECAGTPALMTGGMNKNYMVLKFTQVQLTGGVTPVVCALDDPRCDFGARFVRLVG